MGQLTNTFAEVQSDIDRVFPKTSGVGIKVDQTTPTFPWRDITSDIVVRNVVATSPTFAAWNGGIRQYQFGVNDEVFHIFHMPHDWVPGSDVYIHAHWSHGTGATPTASAVTWGFEVTWAKGFNQEAFGSTITTTAAENANTTTLTHMVTEVQLTAASPSASQIDTDLLEVDGLFILRTYLSANASGEDPFLHTVDLHYQSSNIGTKGKAPNFYT